MTDWYKGNSGGETCPVGQKSSNELGLYDMSDNVWEWCGYWVGEYNNASHQVDPMGSPSGLKRVNRGGSWRYRPIIVVSFFGVIINQQNELQSGFSTRFLAIILRFTR